MKRLYVLIWTLTGCLAAGYASAYDAPIHGYITYQAYLQSSLGNSATPPLLQQLGLDRLDAPRPFFPYWVPSPLLLDLYYDNAATDSNKLLYRRYPSTAEWWVMQQLLNAGTFGTNGSSVVGSSEVQPLPIVNWLMRGVIREDDLLQSDPHDGPLPDADPRGEFRRVFNHFYDPINNRMLHASRFGLPDIDCSSWPSGFPTYAGAYCGKSIDWALGTTDAFASLAPASNHANHFSWEDARQDEFLALVAERDANSNGVREASEREADSEERLFRWATVFRSLGDVIHLLQDAAQPQHARVDPHDPHVDPNERQAFEPFTTARLLGIPPSGQQGNNPTGGETYVYNLTGKQIAAYVTPLPGVSGYPKPAFASPLRFFTTRAPGDTAMTSPANRVGMADYSNRGFFTRGTLPGTTNFSYPPAPVADGTNGYTATSLPCSELPSLQNSAVVCKTYYHTVPDVFQSSRSDVVTAQPMVADGMWKDSFGSIKAFSMSPAIFQAQGDLTIPRAIAYSAGMVDYFFRGKLAVTAPVFKVVAVLNQGAQHTMNAQGYPCVGAATNDGCPVFGFQSVRVSVQNTTPAIIESGPGGVTVNQDMSATLAGSVTDPNFSGPYLVAIAKYHRNTCYKPNLSGEPSQAFSPTTIIQPTCDVGQTTRTGYQELSVSKSAVASAAQLASGAAAFDVRFDFSADPIPVNATDLFIQVVYRGPMGNAATYQEPDAIAVGTLDVREPTFAAFWNNTDYYWNVSVNPAQWTHESPTGTHNEVVQSFWVCSGFPLKMMYEYNGVSGPPAMVDPIVSSTVPGMVRIALVYPPPDFAGQMKTVQGTPTHTNGDVNMFINSKGTSGMFRQANLENVSAATIAAPYAGCASSLPNAPQYWCFDPIQKRRGQLFGTPALPVFIAPGGFGSSATDVDSVPLPTFTGTVPLQTGTVRFDTDATLVNCASQPTSAPVSPNDAAYETYLNLLNEARDLGVSGETEAPTQQYQ